MDEEQRKIVMIPGMPKSFRPDLLFRTPRGFAVQASDAEIETIRGEGIAVAQLYASAEDYVAAMQSLSKEDAIAAVETVQNQVLAALDPKDRDQFQVA